MGNEKKQATIMLVDDSPGYLEVLSLMLESSGYQVRAFLQGELALSAARIQPPDLILLDVNMPTMNGFEVCRRLKAEKTLQDIPVIFISALAETSDKIQSFAVGGVDYVIKPFQFEEVQARVNTHLHLRTLQKELKSHNLHLEDMVKEQIREISDSQLATIYALSKLAESRDDDTGYHIERTQIFCKLLAEYLQGLPHFAEGIDTTFIENIYHAAPLHDIGKVGIPDHILLKPGRLTPAEFEIMQTHTLIGEKTLGSAYSKYPRNTFLRMGIAIAQSHHEKWDGSGYPERLVGAAIPLSARIMAIVDVYDALRSKRPYKIPFSHEKSVEIIKEGAGQHFDPAIVDAFLTLEADFYNIRQRMDAGEI